MSFLSPLFLVGAIAAAIPVVLHLLHREPEPRLQFPAVRLLRRAPVEDARRRRLREWLLLALRVSALTLIAIAFARPFLSRAAASGGHVTIVALDTSLSMSMPGRFARAQELARRAIASAGSADRVGVVTFADAAGIALAPTTDHALATSTVDRAQTGFGATRYRAALAAASQALESAGGSSATILVVTDLQANGWDAGDRAVIPERAAIQMADAGAGGANLAVTALTVRGSRAVATIRNEGASGREARIHLAVDGQHAGDAAVTIAPGASAEVDLGVVRGEAVSATVDDDSGMQGDNTRFAVAGAASRPVVAVVTTNGDTRREAFYAEQALAAGGSDARFSIVGMATAGVSKLSQPDGRPAVVFLLSTKGLDERARAALAAFIHGGGGVFVAYGPDVDADVVAQTLGIGAPTAPVSPAGSATPAALVPVDLRHPVFQAFGAQAAALGLARFTAVAGVPQKACSVVARFTNGDAAMSECTSGAGRAMVFGSDLDNRGNDLPLHPSFVPFVQESAAYLAGNRSAGSDVLVADVPQGVRPAPGIVTLEAADGRAARRIAVNVDPGESDADRLTPAQFEAAVSKLREAEHPAVQLQDRERESRQRLWQYALLLAIALLAGESLVAARTA